MKHIRSENINVVEKNDMPIKLNLKPYRLNTFKWVFEDKNENKLSLVENIHQVWLLDLTAGLTEQGITNQFTLPLHCLIRLICPLFIFMTLFLSVSMSFCLIVSMSLCFSVFLPA